jgi:hypothetical protein
MLLGSLENKGESFIDVNAHQKIRDSFKQAVIYEKYANPIKDEQGATYQSVIKQLIVDCTGKPSPFGVLITLQEKHQTVN